MERAFLSWLQGLPKTHPAVQVGIGDDAAVLRGSGESLVVATDMLLEGVHFEAPERQPRRVGRKAMAVNLSDLAAMGAQPVAAFASLALPRASAAGLAPEITAGLLELTQNWSFDLAGGDTNCWNGPLVINVAVVGSLSGPPWLRSGARPGDILLVTGELGGSLAGRHYDFMPRLDEADALRRCCDVHAAADISDGLAVDAHRMAEASGCGAALELAAVPVSQAARQAATAGGDAISHALGDGEDFELLLAVAPDDAGRLLQNPPFPTRLTAVGRFVEQPGLWRVEADGQLLPQAIVGFEHDGSTGGA